MKRAIFLGAGASAAEGAPIQDKLFSEYFQSIQQNFRQHEMERELATFFYLLFGIDVDSDNLDKINFPTYEEILGMVDLAEKRKESFKDFDLESIASNSNRIRFIRQYLVLLMAQVIHDKLLTSNQLHEKLIKSLMDNDFLKDTFFITTNYDILIDNALYNLNPDILLDYGIDFLNLKMPVHISTPEVDVVKLFKVHGSLNWLYCPTCNNVTLTLYEKGVIRLLTNFDNAFCTKCKSVFNPIIVPPTFYKDFSNVFLSTIWNKAENDLRNIDHLIFCGYSFPDADMHIKYLIKRIQTNRSNSLKITVFNNHTGKNKNKAFEEEIRYKRFLGEDVEYTDKSFEDLVNEPMKYL